MHSVNPRRRFQWLSSPPHQCGSVEALTATQQLGIEGREDNSGDMKEADLKTANE